MELFQELGDGDGGEVVGLHRSRRKVIQGFIYLKLNYLFSGFPSRYDLGLVVTPPSDPREIAAYEAGRGGVLFLVL
jgi:hypothetical protein